jgi:hypothetical protein
MKNLHVNSPCCLGSVIKFGNRRRQCTVCRKTWRIRKKKTGRKRKRVSSNLAIKYLNHEIPPIRILSRIRHKSVDQYKLELKKSLLSFNAQTSWSPLPQNETLVLVADAMRITISNKVYSLYVILVKNTLSSEAIITEPLIESGSESLLGWRKAFATLPTDTLRSVKALVCDGNGALVSIAKYDYSWALQRCHFHLIARIQGRRSSGWRSRHRKEGQVLYQTINDILTNPDENVIPNNIKRLQEIINNTGSQILRKALSGFIKHYRDYRTYIIRPELNLPRTSNSIESVMSTVRNLCYRTRGFNTLPSLTLWVHALLKLKRKTTCNGDSPTKLIP